MTHTTWTKFTFKKGVPQVLEVAVEISYQFSIATSSTYTSSLKVPILPWTRAWVSQKPQMFHVAGTVLVRRNGVYYRLPEISGDFPRKIDGQSVTTIESRPLPRDTTKQLPKAGIDGTIVTSSAGGTGSKMSLFGGSYDLPAASAAGISDSSKLGALQVRPDSATTWSTRESEADPAASGGSITEGSFSYQIVENGVPQPYWVAGSADNGYTTVGARNTQARCAIYSGDPTDGGTIAPPTAQYQCLAVVSPPDTDNVMAATFTVGPRLADVTPASPPAAAAVPPATGVTVIAALTPRPTGATGLASTGSSVDGTPLLAALLALLGGAGLMVLRRRRRTQHG